MAQQQTCDSSDVLPFVFILDLLGNTREIVARHHRMDQSTSSHNRRKRAASLLVQQLLVSSLLVQRLLLDTRHGSREHARHPADDAVEAADAHVAAFTINELPKLNGLITDTNKNKKKEDTETSSNDAILLCCWSYNSALL